MTPDSGQSGGSARWVLTWTIAGLALRGLLIGFTNRITGDGVGWYIPMARAFFEGRWSDGFDVYVPPVYSIFVSAVARLLPAAVWQGPLGEAGALELAAQITSALFGTASIPLVYLLVRRLAPSSRAIDAARVGVAMAAFSPFLSRLGAQVLTEATYTFFFLVAALAGLALLRERRPGRAALFGLAVGLACLNRPEAMGLLIIIGAWIGLPALLRPRALAGSAGLGLLVAAFFLVGLFPQMAVTHARSGVWTLSAKGGAIFKKSLLGDEVEKEKWLYPAPRAAGGAAEENSREEKKERAPEGSRMSIPGFIARNPLLFTRHYVTELLGFAANIPEVMGIGLLAFGLVGTLARRKIPRGPDEGVGASIPIAYLLMLSLFHSSERFLFPLLPFAILWSALGLQEVVGRLREGGTARWIARLPGGLRRRPMVWVFRAAMALLFVEAVGTTAHAHHYAWYWSHEKGVGAWMRENLPPGTKVMTRSSMIEAYYAGAPVAYFPLAPYEEVISYLRRTEVRYVLMDDRKTVRLRPEFFRRFTAGDGAMVKTFDYGRKKVFLYEVKARRGAALSGGGRREIFGS